MVQQISIPPIKAILYPLLGFLKHKKLTDEGKGRRRPLAIKLQEFNALFPVAPKGLDEDEFQQLESELQGLREEGDILEILNPEIFDDFEGSYNKNKEIILVYTRQGIIDYEEYLKNGDRERYQSTSDKIELFLDKNVGIYKASDPAKIYSPRGNRYALITSLKYEKVAGFRLAGRFYKENMSTLSHAIDDINEKCRHLLGVDGDIITRAGTTGYRLNEEYFKFTFKDG